MQHHLPAAPRPRTLTDTPVPTRLKLSALWTSVLFLYLYGDYFELYAPGKLPAMLAGRMALGAASQGALLSMAALMAVPSLLVAGTLLLPTQLARWLNLGLGLLYTGIMGLAIQGSWPFYQLLGGLEMGLTALVTWTAWRWPSQRGGHRVAPDASQPLVASLWWLAWLFPALALQCSGRANTWPLRLPVFRTSLVPLLSICPSKPFPSGPFYAVCGDTGLAYPAGSLGQARPRPRPRRYSVARRRVHYVEDSGFLLLYRVGNTFIINK